MSAKDLQASTEEPATTAPAPRRWRRVLWWVVTGLAAALVFAALVMPNRLEQIGPRAFLRIPVEGLLAFAVLLALPGRARRIAAAACGVVLGLLTVLKMLDIGFLQALNRPFDPILDWVLFDDGFNFLADNIGKAGAVGTAIAAVLLVIAVLVLTTLSMLRLCRLMARYDRPARGALGGISVVWFIGLALGLHAGPYIPVSALVHDRVVQAQAAIKDKRTFAREAANDPMRDTPGEQLVTSLRGKDVIVTFVESYGRSAVESPEFAAPVDAELAAGTKSLQSAGFSARSGFLTSPAFGGGSWLGHSTFLSGLWIENQQRYRTLIASDRLTLPRAFAKAGWQTYGIEPGNRFDWPEGSFYDYDKVYDSRNMGYKGPMFGWSTMPDQYTLADFGRQEYSKPNRPPLMAEITLTSSHSPWAPQPTYVDWDQVGDGSIYHGIAARAQKPGDTWNDEHRIRAAYARSITYSLTSIVSWIEKYGNKNLVMVFLGDHQPATVVAGTKASHDVPVTIVAGDPAVLKLTDSWGWTDGLKPSPQAPVWRMDTFRDRFLTTFGSITH